jgi:hypothetical protein
VSAGSLRLRAGNGAEALGGVPPPSPAHPPPRLRATRSPARRRRPRALPRRTARALHGGAIPPNPTLRPPGSRCALAPDEAPAESSLDAGRSASRPSVPRSSHCRQSAAVDLVPHQGVAAVSPLGERCEASPHSGRMKLLYLAAPGEDVPSATHTSLLGRYQPSCFKRRSQRKCREVSEPGFGHQDKGLASVERQALEVQAVR